MSINMMLASSTLIVFLKLLGIIYSSSNPSLKEFYLEFSSSSEVDEIIRATELHFKCHDWKSSDNNFKNGGSFHYPSNTNCNSVGNMQNSNNNFSLGNQRLRPPLPFDNDSIFDFNLTKRDSNNIEKPQTDNTTNQSKNKTENDVKPQNSKNEELSNKTSKF